LGVLGRVVPLLCFVPWLVPYMLMRRRVAVEGGTAVADGSTPASDEEG